MFFMWSMLPHRTFRQSGRWGQHGVTASYVRCKYTDFLRLFAYVFLHFSLSHGCFCVFVPLEEGVHSWKRATPLCHIRGTSPVFPAVQVTDFFCTLIRFRLQKRREEGLTGTCKPSRILTTFGVPFRAEKGAVLLVLPSRTIKIYIR